MAWTTPRTWVTGELVTASIMNTHIRDNENALAARALAFWIGDVASVALTSGVKGYLYLPFAMTLSAWTLISGDSTGGSIQLDVWKAAYPTIPTVANTITGAEKPLLAAQQQNQDSSLTTWTTNVSAGDVLGINVDSTGSTIKQVTLTLSAQIA